MSRTSPLRYLVGALAFVGGAVLLFAIVNDQGGGISVPGFLLVALIFGLGLLSMFGAPRSKGVSAVPTNVDAVAQECIRCGGGLADGSLCGQLLL